jgi:hypothetical protein
MRPLSLLCSPSSQDVDLRQCGTVKSADDLTNRPFSFTGVRASARARAGGHTRQRVAQVLTPRQSHALRLSPRTVQVPERNFFLIAADDADRNEWVAAIGARARLAVTQQP